jgi:hypothetical protein
MIHGSIADPAFATHKTLALLLWRRMDANCIVEIWNMQALISKRLPQRWGSLSAMRAVL